MQNQNVVIVRLKHPSLYTNKLVLMPQAKENVRYYSPHKKQQINSIKLIKNKNLSFMEQNKAHTQRSQLITSSDQRLGQYESKRRQSLYSNNFNHTYVEKYQFKVEKNQCQTTQLIRLKKGQFKLWNLYQKSVKDFNLDQSNYLNISKLVNFGTQRVTFTNPKSNQQLDFKEKRSTSMPRAIPSRLLMKESADEKFNLNDLRSWDHQDTEI